MFIRILRCIIAVSIITGIFTSCSITFTGTPFELAPEADYSFLVAGEAVETNNVVSVINNSWRRNRNSSPQANIHLAGSLKKPFMRGPTQPFIPPTIRLQNQESDALYFLPGHILPYLWDGSVTIDGHSVSADVSFDVYANRDGSGKQFILTKAAMGQVSLEFNDPFDIYRGAGVFPYLVGYAHISGSQYRIYAVLDNSPDRSEFNLDIFYNPLQKFQFLDEQDTVVAELEQGVYIIYDTLPATERINIKEALALFVAFKHSSAALKDINGWDIPMFYRDIYQ